MKNSNTDGSDSSKDRTGGSTDQTTISDNDKVGTTKTLLVTVGTTLFDKLILAISREETLEWMIRNHYTHVIVQYGKGNKPLIEPSNYSSKIQIELYRYKPNLKDDMEKADLIISHAGAGTVMEGMKLQKRLVVVINTLLMDNHQFELANAFGQRNYLFVVENPDDLLSTTKNQTIWNEIESFRPVLYQVPRGNDYEFPNLLDNFMFGHPTRQQPQDNK